MCNWFTLAHLITNASSTIINQATRLKGQWARYWLLTASWAAVLSLDMLDVRKFEGSSFFQVHAFSWSLKKKEWLVEEWTEVWPSHEFFSVCYCSLALSHVCYKLCSMGPLVAFCVKSKSVKLRSNQCFPVQKQNDNLKEPLCDSSAL